MRLNPAEADDRHLRVDQLRADLRERAVRSGAAVVAAQIGTALVALAGITVLARLLPPEHFGLVAMAFPVVIFALVVRSFGLDIELIRRERLGRELGNLIFWRALRLNCTMALMLAALAPAVALFYHEPRLLAVTLSFAASVILLSLAAHHEAILKRQMRFAVLSAINLASVALGVVLAIVLAYLGAGYWALVGQTVVIFLMRNLLAWIFCDWRPWWPQLDPREAKAIFGSVEQSGWNLTGTRLLTLSSSYFDRVMVGWLAGPAVLGLYENGRRLAFFPLDTLYSPLLDVAVAGLSRTAGNDARYRSSAGKAVQLVLALMLPFLAFVLVEMRPATLLLLGERWLPAVPLAQLLVIAAFAQGLTRTLMWFYLARDESARQVRWFALQSAIIVIAVTIGAWTAGSFGVALGFTCATWLLTIPAIVYGLHRSPFSARDFAGAAARPVLLSLGAAALLFAIESILPWSSPPLLHCSVAVVIFGMFYVGGWAVLPGGSATGAQLLRLLSSALRA